jgi:hemerythrin-like domain-containing protein
MSPVSESDDTGPIDLFARCHEGILTHLQALAGLPALVSAASRARSTAAETLRFFRAVVYEHHQEEERELFPAVLASARPGDEKDQVQAIVERLMREHRKIEAAYGLIEPGLKDAAKGQPDSRLQPLEVAALVTAYEAHARFEETVFLPLSQQILSRNGDHMAALGLSLHLRHALPDVLAKYGSRI